MIQITDPEIIDFFTNNNIDPEVYIKKSIDFYNFNKNENYNDDSSIISNDSNDSKNTSNNGNNYNNYTNNCSFSNYSNSNKVNNGTQKR